MASSSSKGSASPGPKRGLRDWLKSRKKDKSPAASQARVFGPKIPFNGQISEDRVLNHDENIQLALRPATQGVPSNDTNHTSSDIVVGDAGNDVHNGENTAETHAPTITEQVLKPIREVWNEAYEDLRVEDEDLITKYEAKLREVTYGALAIATVGRPQKQVLMDAVVNKRLEEYKEGNWKVKALGEEFLIKDMAKPLVSIIKWADKYVGDALKSNPMASIGWAGVMVFIPVRLPSELRPTHGSCQILGI